MIQKFKSRSVEIEAIQYTGHNDSEIRVWAKGLIYPSPVLEPTEHNPSGSYLQIETWEGYKVAIVSDWIIKDEEGKFSPCKNDIFLLTHDAIVPESKNNTEPMTTDEKRLLIDYSNYLMRYYYIEIRIKDIEEYFEHKLIGYTDAK